jgi:hypothetical protein
LARPITFERPFCEAREESPAFRGKYLRTLKQALPIFVRKRVIRLKTGQPNVPASATHLIYEPTIPFGKEIKTIKIPLIHGKNLKVRQNTQHPQLQIF